MSRVLYSIRMRASRAGSHVSGAERITGPEGLSGVSAELVERASSHERGRPDSITVTIDSLAGKEIVHAPPLPVTALEYPESDTGRESAVAELVSCGVSERAARTALAAITAGAAPGGGNMRGAMVVDAATGERLEDDRAKGVRARAVDWQEGALGPQRERLKNRGLDRAQFTEALALATKVSMAPGAVAELCISDDPGYVTGYVASQNNGYVRITPLKDEGEGFGGRAFFVDASAFDMEAYLKYMRETPVLVGGELSFKTRT